MKPTYSSESLSPPLSAGIFLLVADRLAAQARKPRPEYETQRKVAAQLVMVPVA
nr:MAG TPA: hypothetical protein [Caudoviricetes sp.]